MKASTARPSRRSAPAATRRARPAKTRAVSTRSGRAHPTGLIESGAAIATAALKHSRFAALAGFAPSVVRAVGSYARRKPVRAAGLAIGIGGLLYLGRAIWNQDLTHAIEDAAPEAS